MYLSMNLFVLILLLFIELLECADSVFHQIGKFRSIISSKNFFSLPFLSLLLQNFHNAYIGSLDIVSHVFRLFFLYSFLFMLHQLDNFHHIIIIFAGSSVSSNQLPSPSSKCFVSLTVLFSSKFLFCSF